MTVKTVTCIVISCSGCGAGLPPFEFGTPHYATVEAARADADAYDWWSDGDIDLCDGCNRFRIIDAEADEDEE